MFLAIVFTVVAVSNISCETRKGSAPCAGTVFVGDALHISVVLPCLNEAETAGRCVAEARRALDEHGLHGEIVVADNGSNGHVVVHSRLAK